MITMRSAGIRPHIVLALSLVSLAVSACMAGFAGGGFEAAYAAELAAGAADLNAQAADVTWTAEDFTYADYEQLLYGCDYSRQFTVAGRAVAGFSDTGKAKLESCTDLVIPARDDAGDYIVGVAPKAFYDCGLTSVTFPTGMYVPYDDELTERVTLRGNFVIGEYAFSKNKLTDVYLPSGVVAVMSGAFNYNQIKTLSLPQSIWWVETMSFANNRLETVGFPETTDFHLEMHGMAFAGNQIKYVRLPNYTEVVNKDTFAMNPGMEESPDEYANKANIIAKGYPCGVVYLYTDNAGLRFKDRIHHIEKTTASTKSYTQKLVVNDGTPETQCPSSTLWTLDDFAIEGTTVTGLSESGEAKRALNKNLVIPLRNDDGDDITELASTDSEYGLFATEDEGFDTVQLPFGLKKIGKNAFTSNGLKDVTWPPQLESIGMTAFRNNNLNAVTLPDTVADLGEGAFSTNASIARVHIPAALTAIPDGAFGCSDKLHWMTAFTTIEIPDTVTKIGNNAFAGNNFERIVIPGSVAEIGRFAFSTKNYLFTPCTLELNEGLRTIGTFAFRNKIIDRVKLPSTLEKLEANTFAKEYSDGSAPLVTKVIAGSQAQYENKQNFPSSDWHTVYYVGDFAWKAEDFTYGTMSTAQQDLQLSSNSGDKLAVDLHVITGLTEQGAQKVQINPDVVIPAVDPDGVAVCGLADGALKGLGITSIEFPADVVCTNDKPEWNNSLEQRGNFVIGPSALYGNKLTSLELPEGVLAVLGNAFGNNSLESVKLPSTLFYIGNQAFARNQIQDAVFPSAADFPLQIAAMAFAQNRLRMTLIPSNTGFVNKFAFVQNTGMEPVTSGNDSEKQGGVVWLFVAEDHLGDHVATVTNGASNVQDVKIGASELDATEWEASDFTFEGTAVTGWSSTGRVKRLVSHDLIVPPSTPDGKAVTAIGAAAFRSPDYEVDYDSAKYDYSCAYGLTSVVLPATLRQIGDDAFMYNSLESVDFAVAPDLSTIGQTAFKGNHLKSLHLPDSVSELGAGAFAANNIAELRLSPNVAVIPEGAFSMNIRLAAVDIPDTVTEIGDTAFAGARLESLEIPASVAKIGRKAFHLHHLESLVVPGTVKEIGAGAFEGTYKAQTLKNLTLCEGIESIGAGAFKEGLLTQVELPASLRELGSEPFLNNTGNGSAHVVRLTSKNVDQLAFNAGASTHQVVLAPGVLVAVPAKQPTLSAAGQRAHYATPDGLRLFADAEGLTELSPADVVLAQIVDIKVAKVSLAASQAYTGRALKPAVKVSVGGKVLAAGKDYTVAYSNNKQIGKARVVISGKGAYGGSVAKTFKVVPAKASVKSVASAKKRLTVKAKAQKGGVKYQFAYKIKGTSKWKTVKASKAQVAIKKLKSGKTYTVRVRAFKKVGSATYFGAWSKAKSKCVK